MTEWFEKNEYKSYDLCDISSKKYFLNIKNRWSSKKYGKYVVYPHDLFINNFAGLLRKSLGIKKQNYAQAQALIARGFLKLYQSTDETSYLKRAQDISEWIISKRSAGFKNYCWGQPYDWFSGKIIPANIPRTTVSSQVGNAFVDFYEVTQNEEYLNIAKSVGDFFVNDMKRSHNTADKICFSYTTIDNHKVHNANMMAASLLSRLWQHTKDDKFYKIAEKVNKFSVNEQNEDGSWFYSLYDDGRPSKIDNYHTGYILESLAVQKRYLREKFSYQKQFQKGITYYIEKLFEKGIVPRLTDKKLYPVDIQSCAQAVITFASIYNTMQNYRKNAIDVLNYTVDNFYDENGYFYYRKYSAHKTDKTSYIRWGDSWMFYAVSYMIQQKLIGNEIEI